MKIKDLESWHGLRAANSEGEDAPKVDAMLRFVEAWCDKAEVLLSQTKTVDTDFGPEEFRATTPLTALRDTLLPTEAELGILPVQWTPQCLLIIASTWEHGGDRLFEDMTIFEKKMVADMKIMVDAQAQEATVTGE